MKNIIIIQQESIGGNMVRAVNARSLHSFLDSKQDFSTWIKSRIEQYGFVEGQDYVVHKTVDNPLGGRPTLDYHASIDMGKELSMVERNAKGKEARQYFIECERKAKAIDPMQALNDPAAMRGMLLSYTEKVIALESTVAAQAPKVAALDRIATTDGMLHLQAAGKVLQQQPNKFIAWLREINWIYKRAGNANNYPRADKANAGYMTVKAVTITQQDGSDKTREQTFITPKGLAKLALMLGVQPDLLGGV